MSENQLRAIIAQQMPETREGLRRLVRIPSVAFGGFDHTQLDRSAEAVADLFRNAGLPETRVVRVPGGQPAVLAIRPAPAGAPTVLLYAHHDVQPAGDRDEWASDPFEVHERDGRVFGRGAADDKAGIMVHVSAIRALGESLGVGLIVLIEGEEEIGSSSLEELLRRHCGDQPIDVIVLADSGNWSVGSPALTTSLRGSANLVVEVQTLESSVHSGFFGGPVPDALTALCRLLATFHDEAGDVAVAGLSARTASALDYPSARLRHEAGMLPGVEMIGTGEIVDRLWTKPAISVLGVDAPSTAEAANALLSLARAKVGLRLAPDDDPQRAVEAVMEHCHRHVPWGATVRVTVDQVGGGSALNTDSPVFDVARDALTRAWDGTQPVDVGIGGSIPFISTFQRMFPKAAVLITGVEDPGSRAHGPNESLHLGDFERACLAEALLLESLANPGR